VAELAEKGSVSKAVLVTGCSSGIGRATAEVLARGGMTVYATARRLETIDDLASSGCRLLQLDVTAEDSIRAAVDTVARENGAVGILVNNAGYGQEGAVEDVPVDEVRRQFETNLFGLHRLTQLVLPGMREQEWGRVVNVSSMGGRLTFPGGGVYHASKHALEALSDALRYEVRPFGVDVVVIEPGLVKTRFGETSVGSIHSVTDDAGPYRDFNAGVARVVGGAYGGAMARLAVEPEAVARVIEKAITAPRPRPRYVAPGFVRLLLLARRVLPDRMWDAALRLQFPVPSRRR
jgi:NAD(P)-dependent dehydrogenase (short-subunit alcohol dehydrogenase family)